MNSNKKDINFPINENTLNRINQSASLIFSNLSVSLLKENANWTFNAHYLQFEDGHGSMILQKKIDSLIQYSVNKAFELETMLQSKINFENSKSNEPKIKVEVENDKQQ